MTNSAATQSALPYLKFCEQRQPDMLAMLQCFVERESPSYNKDVVDRLGEVLAQEFERMGGTVKIHQQTEYGDHVQADFAGRKSGKPIMLLGHFDTVWPLGTLDRMPFRIDNTTGRAHGPGVLDMKAALVMMMYALQALKDAGAEHRPVTIFLDTDEEIGSESSRPITESIAKGCEAVLVLEPGQGPQGLLKTSRKGVGNYQIQVHGVASHAGVDFEKGHSAVIELSRQILEIMKFVDLARGITVNPGVIHGGTRSNVIAAEASAEVDVRIARMADAAILAEKFSSLRAFDPQCRVQVSGGVNRPPMERSEGTARLLEIAQGVGRQLGLDVGESATGGGSDGNFTAALGIPTLDGLGAVGEGAHAGSESIILSQLHLRTALLAGLIQQI
jgi:glutamate carboxypeptidase